MVNGPSPRRRRNGANARAAARSTRRAGRRRISIRSAICTRAASVGAAGAVAARRVRAAAAPASSASGPSRWSVQRFADYRAERADGLTAWLPMAMPSPARRARRWRCSTGDSCWRCSTCSSAAPATRPRRCRANSPPAAEAMVARLGHDARRAARSRPGSRSREIDFTPGHVEANAAMLADLDGDDAMVVTRFGIAAGDGQAASSSTCSIRSPRSSRTAPSLTGKVHGKTAEPDPAWRSGLTRAVMGVSLPGPLGACRADHLARHADGTQGRRRHPDQRSAPKCR